MSTRQLKEKIVSQLEQTDDEKLLEEVLELLRVHSSPEDTVVGEPVFKLSPGMRASIQEGLDDVASGRVTSDEEAEKELDEWFIEEDKKWGEK